MKILNNREAKKVLADIEEHWGCDLAPLLKEFAFAVTDKDKLYMFGRALFDAPIESSVKVLGVYVASLRDAKIRLSIEGAELVSRTASRNVIDVSTEQAAHWIRGRDLEVSDERTGFLIVRRAEDVLGCGYSKDGVLLNFVPKVRRIHAE